MDIFSKGRFTKPQFVTKLLSLVVTLILFAFTCSWQFPGDTLSGETLEYGAMHKVFNSIFILGAFLYFIILLRKGLDEDLGFEFEPSDGKYSYFKPIALTVLTFLLVLGNRVYDDSKVIFNKSVEYVNQYEQVNQEKTAYYDNMWKTYTLKDNILLDNKETFIEVTKILMEGRRSDGNKLAWKWIHENQPVPYEEFSNFSKDLSAFVESQRSGYLSLEVKSQNIARDNNTLLKQLPNNIYNKFLDLPLLNYKQSFTSQKTTDVFKSGVEEVESNRTGQQAVLVNGTHP